MKDRRKRKEHRTGPTDRRTPEYRHAFYLARPSHGRRHYDLIVHGNPDAPVPKGIIPSKEPPDANG